MSVAQMSEVSSSWGRAGQGALSQNALRKRKARGVRGRIEIEDLVDSDMRLVRPVRLPLDIPDFFTETAPTAVKSSVPSERDGKIERSKRRESAHGATARGHRQRTKALDSGLLKGQRKELSEKRDHLLLQVWNTSRAVVSSSQALKIFAWLLSVLFITTLALAIGTSFLPADAESVIVQSGDTLWSIASGIEGASTTQSAVNDIVSLNGLGTEEISVGQKLLLPSY